MTGLLCLLISAYTLVLFGRIIFSWFPIGPSSPLSPVQSFLHAATEPVLGPIRGVLPSVPLGGMRLDLSPLVVLFGLQILRSFCNA